MQGQFLWELPDAKKRRLTKLKTSLNLRETLRQFYLTYEAQELHITSCQAQKHTLPIHTGPGIPSLLCSVVLPCLSSAQHFNHLTFFGHHLFQYVMSLACNLIGALPSWRLKRKWNRPLTIPPYAAK